MSATTVEIAEGLTTILNAGAFSKPVTAERKRVPDYNIEDMETVKLVVVAGPIEVVPRNRQKNAETHEVHVGVLKKLADETTDADAMDEFIEEVFAHLSREKIGLVNGQAMYQRHTYTPNMDEMQFWQNGLFFGLIRVTYLVIQ